MQSSRLPLLASFLTMTLFACCGEKPTPAPAPAPVQESVKPADPHAGIPAAKTPAAQPAKTGTGKILETMDAGGYTYARVDAGGKQDWYAVQQCALKVGDEVELPAGAMPMHDFESKTLNKKFDVIYFAQGFQKVGASAAAAQVQQAHGEAAKVPVPAVELKGVAKAEGGMTVAEIWAQGAAGDGKDVAVRGKVVKFNGGIMGKNWLHIRDGSGAEGSNDITITTDGEAKVGDTVLVKGKLAKDRDFGAGYSYALMIEDAKITVE